MDLLLGLQVLMPAPPMPGRSRPLTPAPPAGSAAIPCPGRASPPQAWAACPPACRLPAPSFSLEVPNSIRLSVTTRCFSAASCSCCAATVAASVAFSASRPHVLPGQPRVTVPPGSSARSRQNAASSAGRDNKSRSHHAKAAPPPVPVLQHRRTRPASV